MTLFYYKATTPDGNISEGEIDAPSRDAVIERLQSSGLLPIRAEEMRPRQLNHRLFGFVSRTKGIGAGDIQTFTQGLATLLHAGLPLDRSLKLLQHTMLQKNVHDMIASIAGRITRGIALSDALKSEGRIFSKFYLSIVRAGEASGQLEAALMQVSDYLDWSGSLRKSLHAALTYPLILSAVSLISVLALLLFVIPEFIPMFSDVKDTLPLPTQLVLFLSDTLQQYGWLLCTLVAGATLFLRYWWTRPAQRRHIDRIALHLPVLSDLLIKIHIARFYRSLGTLLNNGVPVVQALRIAKATLSNQFIVEAIDQAAQSVKEGQNLAEIFSATGLFPPLAIQLTRVGEESGTLEPMLLKVADIYDDDVKASLQRLTSILEPVLIIGLGLFIAGIIVSILLAIMSVNQLAI